MEKTKVQLYIISVQQNVGVHAATSNTNTKLILQQTIRNVCFAQLIPKIQLEINGASTVLKGNMVWCWSQLKSCR